MLGNGGRSDDGRLDSLGTPAKTVGNEVLQRSNCRGVLFRDNTVSDTRPLPRAFDVGAGVEGFRPIRNRFSNGVSDPQPQMPD